MFADFFVRVILVLLVFKSCTSTGNLAVHSPKVALPWQVLACTRRQLAQYIVVVVRQTYDLCVCWHPMPAGPSRAKGKGKHWRGVFDHCRSCSSMLLSNVKLGKLFLLSTWWQRWEWVCEQDSVASRLNQVQEGKGDGVQQRRSRKGSSIPFISS